MTLSKNQSLNNFHGKHFERALAGPPEFVSFGKRQMCPNMLPRGQFASQFIMFTQQSPELLN